MLTEERQSKILELVNRQKSIKLTDICTILEISESTARRDLKELADKNLLIKVHGGAVSKEDSFFNIESGVEEKSKLNMEEKITVAKYAASLVEDGDFIFMDAGTTTEGMIDFLPAKDAVFVTNGLVHALRLAKKGFRVILTGGEVKAVTEALIGADCVLNITKMNFTKSFIGVNGISLKNGMTTPDVTEASIKEAVLRNSKVSYILADHSKFDTVTAVGFATFEDAVIITDCLKNKAYRNEAKMIILSDL